MKPRTKIDGGGLRKDTGKLRVDLIPADVQKELAKVLTFGAKKYAERNWERGMPWSKAAGPLDRHWLDFKLGLRVDPESKCLTIAHVLCNAVFLCAWELRGLQGLDDLEPFARALVGVSTSGPRRRTHKSKQKNKKGH